MKHRVSLYALTFTAIVLLPLAVVVPHHHHGEAVCFGLAEEMAQHDAHHDNEAEHNTQNGERKDCQHEVCKRGVVTLHARSASFFVPDFVPLHGFEAVLPHPASHTLREAATLFAFFEHPLQACVGAINKRGPPARG